MKLEEDDDKFCNLKVAGYRQGKFIHITELCGIEKENSNTQNN